MNETRALAHVELITDIQPIPNADKIEVATILGWKVVIAKKDNFKIGDKVVYIEIDSKVPEKPEFEFLRDRHFKVKTVRLRGQYSQGLIMPMSILNNDYDVGTDVTNELGITYAIAEDNVRKANTINKETKYISMASRHKNIFKRKPIRWLMKHSWGKKILFVFFGKKKDMPLQFPTKFNYIKKTDQTRIENMPWILNDKTPFIRTEKCDGSSATYIIERKKKNKFEFYVCSRNVRMLKPTQPCYFNDNVYWEMAQKYDIENKLIDYISKYPNLSYVCWQGEICGNKIQSNPHKLTTNHLFCFHMIDSEKGFYDIRDAVKIWNQYNMEHVPVDDILYILPDTIEEIKADADGYYDPSVCEGNTKCSREGFVYYSSSNPNLSFKNVSRKYLLKHEG